VIITKEVHLKKDDNTQLIQSHSKTRGWRLRLFSIFIYIATRNLSCIAAEKIETGRMFYSDTEELIHK